MRLIVGLVLFALLAAVIAAPLLAEASSGAAIPLYAAFSWICHQRPQRTWLVGGYPLAVCVRCLGLYVGALGGAVAGPRFSKPLFWVSAAALGVEWLIEASGWAGPPALVRFAVGLPAGFFASPALWGEHRGPMIRIPLERGPVNT